MKRLLYIILIVSLALISVYFSITLYKEVAEQSLADQYHKNEIYAQQAVISIENFFDNFKNSLNFLSSKKEIVYFNEKSESFLKNYMEAYTDQLKAITRVSAEGKIIYTYPCVESVIGEDISSQKHNAEIIESQSPVISDVFETVQGYSAIVYAYPVFKDGEYDGAISLVIPFNYIADKFLRSIKIGETGTSFLVSE
ncbi:MAG: cache domain-containing protein, partial [Melioribacteraceae bacterium]|nr:cache domain-containing protein [Melioribacteraceae bacterium]